MTEARIAPLPEDQWSAEQRALVEKYGAQGVPRNALTTLVRVPALADRTFPFLDPVTNESSLSPRHRTILLLRTACLTQNCRLWSTYASRADEAGLTDDEVHRVAEGPDGWDPFEVVLLGLADQLFRNASVTNETWEQLSAQYDQHNLMDAAMTVAKTTSLAILLNSLGVQPDDDTTARIPSTTVAYRIDVPDREPPLTSPRIHPVDGRGLRITRTLRRHPALAEAWSANPGYVLNPERSRLTPHDRELLILRTGWNAQAVYEWAKHVGSVGRARDHGLEPLWIAQGEDATGWSADEVMLIRAANEMYRDTIIADDTWDALAERFDTHQMMSIAATASRYREVSMTLNAFGVQPLPDDELFPVLEGY